MVNPPIDYAYYCKKNSLANPNEYNSVERMQYLLSKVDRLELF